MAGVMPNLYMISPGITLSELQSALESLSKRCNLPWIHSPRDAICPGFISRELAFYEEILQLPYPLSGPLCFNIN